MNETDQPQSVAKPVAQWRIIVAALLDFLTAFFVLGFIIASVSGGRTESGFKLNGMPALVLFAAIIVYFWIGRKYLGGTIWQRILKAR